MRLFALVAAAIGLALDPGDPTPPTPDFDLEILPLLQRQGCASAYCHGSSTGRGGFKLSLFGSDPAADHRAIALDRGGRRLDLRRPEHSLLLRKPSRALPHEGGLKLHRGSRAYRLFSAWVAAGAHRDPKSRELLQDLSLHRDGGRLRVTAHLQGQEPRDVGHLATYSSSDAGVVSVDAHGSLTIHGPGIAQVFARYAGHDAQLEICQKLPSCPPLPLIGHNPIDRAWLGDLARLGMAPAAAAEPHTLLRRLYLDLADRLPTPAEIRSFMARPAATRIRGTASALIGSAGFNRRFARLLAQWWEIPDPATTRVAPQAKAAQGARAELHQELSAGRSLVEMARSRVDPDHYHMRRFSDPRDRAEWVGRAILGIRLGCARCHDSPNDRWRQGQHLAFAALFASPRPAPGGGMQAGILFHPRSGKPVPSRLLPLEAEASSLPEFLTDPGHGLFFRAMANRVFAALMGHGLVSPLDDHRLSNPPRNAALLAHLASTLRLKGLRGLCLELVETRLYQLGQFSSPSLNTPRYYQGRPSRPLAPAPFVRVIRETLRLDLDLRLPDSPLALQLALLNNPQLRQALSNSPVLLSLAWLAPEPADRLRDLYLLLLSRPPTAAESQALSPALAGNDQGEALIDLAQALICSRAFGSIR